MTGIYNGKPNRGPLFNGLRKLEQFEHEKELPGPLAAMVKAIQCLSFWLLFILLSSFRLNTVYTHWLGSEITREAICASSSIDNIVEPVLWKAFQKKKPKYKKMIDEIFVREFGPKNGPSLTHTVH